MQRLHARDVAEISIHGGRSLAIAPVSKEIAVDAFMQPRNCMESKNTVYILRSESNPSRHYTGLTSDLEKRLNWHNAGQNVDTARDRPWKLVVAFHFANEPIARRFERYLKSGSGREFAKRHFGDAPSCR